VGGADYRVEVHGSVGGNLVVGDHNLIVNAAVGSSVTVVQEADRPKPVRRDNVRVLPRRPPAVLGRRLELGTIAAAVVAQSTIQVYGPAGIGKSTVLRQAAYDVADEADGVVFLTASGRSHLDVPQEIFEACYETSGYRPSPTDLRRLMSGVRVCVVADDLVCSPDELLMILDAAPDAAFVVAAPDRELWGQGQVIELAGIAQEDALALVRRELGRDLTLGESSAVITQWEAAGGSPMRLLRTAAQLGQPTGTPQPTGTTQPGGTAQSGDQAVFAALDQPLLSARERDVLDLLGLVAPSSATIPVLTVLAEAHEPERVATAAVRLVQVGLAVQADDAYRLADDLIEAASERRYRRDTAALVTSLLGWLTRSDVTPTDVAAHGELIVELIEAATRGGHTDLACRLARAAAPLAALSLRWGVWRDVLTSGQAAAKAGDDREAYAYFTHERGIRMLCLGQAAAAAAVLATAAGLWQALGLTRSAAVAAHAQAIANSGASAAVPHIPTQPAGPRPPGAANHPPAPAPGSAPPVANGPVANGPVANGPVANAPAASRGVVGRARVGRRSAGATPAPFPTALVVTIAVIVIVLGVSALLVVPLLTRHSATTSSGTTASATTATGATLSTPQPTADPSAAPSTAIALPPPTAFSDNSAQGSDPAVVLDGDPSTIWSSTPHRTPRSTDSWVGINMGGVGIWDGVSLTSRPRGAGFPTDFRIESSLDGQTWTTVPGQDYNSDHPFKPTGDAQTLVFEAPIQARFVRLFATSLGQGGFVGTAAESAAFTLQLAELHVLS
jgi:hypothetical protein